MGFLAFALLGFGGMMGDGMMALGEVMGGVRVERQEAFCGYGGRQLASSKFSYGNRSVLSFQLSFAVGEYAAYMLGPFTPSPVGL